MKYLFRMIAINEKYGEIELNYPIIKKEVKNQIIDKFNISYDSLIDNQEYRELIVQYKFANRKISRPIEKSKNYLSYSIKEINLNYDDVLFILNLISEEEIMEIDMKNLVWRLCITRTIKDEFLE